MTTTASSTTTASTQLSTTTSTSTTVVPPGFDDDEALFSSLERFLVVYSASSAGFEESLGASYTLSLDDAVVGEIDGFAAGFVASGFFDAGIMYGTLTDAGEVSSMSLLFDPDGPSAASALVPFLGSLGGASTGFDTDPVIAAYLNEVVPSAASLEGEQWWFANSEGTNHSLVITVVPGANPGDPLVEVSIVPVADEEAAKLGVNLARPSILSLIT